MTRLRFQNGFILMPVIIAIVLIATIAFMLNNQSAINVNETGGVLQAEQAEQVAQAGLVHATWDAQNSGCAGDMAMTTVPFGSAGADIYSATVTTPGGTTTAYSRSADQDTWLREANPTQNSGTDNNIRIINTVSGNQYGLYRFDLSGIPAGARINSAIAWFHFEDSDVVPESINIHRATAAWTEADATWETMASQFDSQVMAIIPPAPGDNSWVQVNLAPLVQAWVNGASPNHGIMLRATHSNNESRFGSREAGASGLPRLEVIVGTGPATPMTITAVGTLTGNPTPANDISRSLTRTNVPAYQPPGTITLQLGTDAGEDGMPDSFYTNRNYGGANYMQVHDNGSDWQQYPLIRFDLARLPQGASVRSARLELNLQSLNAPGTATIHQVTRSWVEGTKSGGGIADGATWLTHDGTNAWTTAGGDINASVVAETAINGGETWVSWEVAPLVERWLAGAPNYGLLIKPDSALKQAKFASKEDSNVGVAPKLTITYACECGSSCLAPQGNGNVILVIAGGTPTATELSRKALFESWGYTVNTLDMNSGQTAYNNKFSVNDVVYAPETVDGGTIGNKLTSATIGVVSEEGWLNDKLGIATDKAWTVGSAINVTDTSHYITALFPAGSLDIYAAGMEQLTVSGTNATGLQILADSGGAGSLVVLDEGAALAGGGTAAGRRVMLPLGSEGKFNWDYLNGNGRLLVQRALQWGTGNTDEPPKNLLLVVVDPASLTAQEAAKKALIEGWGYAVNLIDESDSQAAFDAALASNVVAYIPETINPANVGTKLTAATIGIVNEEKMLLVELGFSGEFDSNSRSEIVILDNAHWITSGLALGTTTIATSNQPLTFTNNGSAPGAQTLAETNQVSSFFEPSLLTLETNAALFGGGFAAGRRVSLPWGDSGFNINALNADGLMIMQRAIEWGAGAAGGGVNTVILSTHDTAELGGLTFTAADLAEYNPATATATLYFDGGTLFTDPLENVQSAHVLGNGHIILSTRDNATLGGLSFTQADLVEYDPVADIATLYFNGATLFSDPLTRIASAQVLASGKIILSTWSSATLGGLTFTPVQLALYDPGTDTASLYFDATTLFSDPLDIIDAVHVLGNGHIVLSTWGANTLGGLSYAEGDLVKYDPVTDTATLYFNGAALFTDPLEKLVAAHIKGDDGPPGSGGTPLNVLMIVGNLTLSSKDVGYKALMESWGHTVTLIDDGDSQANYDTAMAASDVVYASGSALGANMLDKATNTTKGLVNEVVGKIDNFGFSSSTSSTVNTDIFTKTDPAHYITEPFSGNPVTVFTASLTNPVPGGTLAPDLQNVGEVTGTLALGTLDTGATRWDSNPSQGRRVHLPFASAEAADLTADGKTILQRAIEWAAGPSSGGGGGPGYTELYQPWSASSNNTWETVNLSAFGVPPDTVVEVAVVNGNTGKEYWGGVRAVGSSLERRFQLHEAEGNGVDAVVMHVQADASSQIQHYSERSADVSFILLGYWVGPTYVERFDVFKAGANASWQAHNLGSYGVGPDQVAEIAISNTSTSIEWLVGTRHTGSSLARLINVHEAESGGVDVTTMQVETDASSIIEVYAGATSVVDFHLLGYWSTAPGTYTEAGGVSGQVSTLLTWEAHDLTTYGIPANAVAQFVLSNEADGADVEIGVRETGSSLQRKLNLQEAEAGPADTFSIHVNVDSSSQVEWYAQYGGGTRFFYPIGWWVLP